MESDNYISIYQKKNITERFRLIKQILTRPRTTFVCFYIKDNKNVQQRTHVSSYDKEDPYNHVLPLRQI